MGWPPCCPSRLPARDARAIGPRARLWAGYLACQRRVPGARGEPAVPGTRRLLSRRPFEAARCTLCPRTTSSSSGSARTADAGTSPHLSTPSSAACPHRRAAPDRLGPAAICRRANVNQRAGTSLAASFLTGFAATVSGTMTHAVRGSRRAQAQPFEIAPQVLARRGRLRSPG